MRDITIHDVAKELNISASTVSRALNDSTNISSQTKKLVLRTAERMGYRVNVFARNLRKDKDSKLIGVIFNKLDSQFSINALYSIENTLRTAGYDVLICHSGEDYEQEIANADNLFQRRVDGLIVSLVSDVNNCTHFNTYIENNIPVLFFDRVKTSFPGVKVALNNFRAAYMATSHLITQGCKRIVHIAGKQTSSIYIERLRGYKQALTDNGIEYDNELVLFRGVDIVAAEILANDILNISPRPDGVFAVNDLCAIKCMQTLIKQGLKIPSDIAFVGFNNDPNCTIIEPNLSTINYSGLEIGAEVARNLINAISLKKTSNSDYTITLSPELIIRESSKIGS